MIKFDRNVHQALKTLEKEGFATYGAGECVRDVLRGEEVCDWDLLTEADGAALQRLFPAGEIIDEEEQILRLDYTCEIPPKEENEPIVVEGAVVDIHPMKGTIEEELARSCFTIDAMADNPERGFVDPFGGREDLKKKLIRTTADADALFQAEPLAMMAAVRLAAETDFDLHQSVFDAIVRNWRRLLDGEIAPVRRELERLLVSDHAGKGLRLMADSGLMTVIFGEEIAGKMSMSDMTSFQEVCQNIDKTKPVRTRRLGLLFTTLSRKKGLAAIERLQFDPKTKLHLDDAMNEIIDIQFLNDDQTFKRYLYEHGMERYEYLHNLSKAMRIVYDQPSTKIEARNYMMRTIQSNGEAVFLEDLVIDANDLMEAGIAETPEQAQELLELVVALVHKNPKNNQRDVLLKMAKKYSKNKLSARMRYIRWIK